MRRGDMGELRAAENRDAAPNGVGYPDHLRTKGHVADETEPERANEQKSLERGAFVEQIVRQKSSVHGLENKMAVREKRLHI